MLNFEHLHSTLLPLLDETDAIIMKGFRNQKEISFKSENTRDVVTDTDIVVEKTLKATLEKTFPEIGFVGEELGRTVGKEYTWVIDPIDGTLNFTKGIPIFGTSIALWKDGVPCYGITSFPAISLRVHAWEQNGVWVNGKKHAVEKNLGTKSFSVFSMRNKAQVRAGIMNKTSSFVEVFRDYGSAAYHISLVAMGTADVAIIGNLALWDIGVAEIFMKEAGLFFEYIGEKPGLVSEKDYTYNLVMGRDSWAKETLVVYNGEVA